VTFTLSSRRFFLKVGTMRAEFGKVNTIHNHALSFMIGRPLVTTILSAAKTVSMTPASPCRVSCPRRKDCFSKDGPGFRGDSTICSRLGAPGPQRVGHLRAYRDLSESTNSILGVFLRSGPTTMPVSDTFRSF